VSGALRSRWWRAGVALIAAYALVLQALFVYSTAARAAAHDTAAFSGSFFVICVTGNDAGSGDGADVPSRPVTHCPICTLAGTTAATLPDGVSLPVRLDAVEGSMTFVTAEACITFHQARAGLSRAPPRNV